MVLKNLLFKVNTMFGFLFHYSSYGVFLVMKFMKNLFIYVNSIGDLFWYLPEMFPIEIVIFYIFLNDFRARIPVNLKRIRIIPYSKNHESKHFHPDTQYDTVLH
jgi:hypothetical protein